MSAWILIPVRDLAAAKSRLSSMLSAGQRRELQTAMLKDVLSACLQAKEISRVDVITRDAEVAGIARRSGSGVIPEQFAGELNAAVKYGVGVMSGQGAPHIMVLPADIPLLDAAEIDLAVRTSTATQRTVIVPDRHDEGTNALLFRAIPAPPVSYGAGSFRRHMTQNWPHPAQALRLDTLALDVDCPADMNELLKSPLLARAKHTSKLLPEILSSMTLPI